MITITGPKSLSLPSSLGGDDQIYGLTLVCVSRGLFVQNIPGGTDVKIEGIKDTELVTPSVVSLLVSKGAEVSGYPVWFELDDVTAACPFAPDSLVDDEGNPVPQETWETWGTVGESHKPVLIDGKYYRSSSVGVQGTPLPASAWAGYLASPLVGMRVVSKEEFLAIQEAAQGPMA